jgi:outer membrane lipoprotein-sorting protein
MKTLRVLTLVAVFILGGILSPALNITAQEAKTDAKAKQILEKMIEAMGGRKTMESVKDTVASGSMEMVTMGMGGAATMTMKAPNKFRMDIEIMGMSIVQAYDGEIGWFTNPQTGAVEEISGDQLENVKRQAMGDQAFLNPDKYGIVYTFKGTEKLEDKDYNVLLMTYEDGFEATMYVDTETHLVHKTVSIQPNDMTGVEAEMESFTTDYRKVDGMMAAFTITQYMDGEEFMVITLDEVKFNSGVEDDVFKKQ